MSHTSPSRVSGTVNAALSAAIILAAGATGVLPRAAAAQKSVLEEVVVTAQRRDESIQDVPLTINRFSGEELRELSLANPRDLVAVTPTLVFQSTSSNLTAPSIYLRGVGNELFNANAASPVGVYVDSTYVGNNTAYGFQLMDLERVEVLKGPQGTLYGRNTTAGLLNYITRKPSVDDGFGGNVSVSYGRFDTYDVEGAVNIPLNQTTAMRIAAKTRGSDGQYENNSPTLVDDTFGEFETKSVRGTLLFEPSDQMDVLISANYGELDGPPGISRPIALLDPASTPVNFGTGLAIVPCPAQPGLGANCADVAGNIPSGQFDVAEKEFTGFEDVQTWGIRAQIDYDFGIFSLQSTSSFDSVERRVLNDADGSPVGGLYANLESDFESFSQEVLLSFNHGKWSGTAGLFYYTDELIMWEGVAVPYITGLFGTPIAGRDLVQETTSLAGFADVTYSFTEKLDVAVGLRVTNDEREGIQSRILVDPALIPQNPTRFIDRSLGFANQVGVGFPATAVGGDSTELSGRVSITYRWTDDFMTYVTGSRGFKGGEITPAPADATEISYSDPEFITAVEVGMKGDFWDRRMRVSAAAFYYDFSDQQVFVEEPLPNGFNRSVIANAGSSTIYGAEANVLVLPIENLRLNLTAAYLEAEYDEFVFDVGDDRSGNRLANAPEVFFSGIAGYTIPLGNGGAVKLQMDANFQDQRFFTSDDEPLLTQDAYWLVGARASYLAPGEQWELSVFGRNLLDEEFFVGGFDFSGLAGSLYPLTVGERLTWGVQASYNF